MSFALPLDAQLLAAGLPEPVAEFRFDPARRWRFDFCYPEPSRLIAIEIEGGVWTGGRHVRGKGFVGDLEKYNRAAQLGYRVFRFTPRQVASGEALRVLEEVLRG